MSTKTQRSKRRSPEPPPRRHSRDRLLLLVGVAAGVIVVAWLVLRGGGAAPRAAASAVPSKISETSARAVVGIYQIDSFTQNDTGCDAPGPAAADAPAYVLVDTTMVLSDRVLQVVGCTAPDDCASIRSSVQAGRGGYNTTLNRYVIEEQSLTRFDGFYAMGGFGNPDRRVCEGRYYEDLALTVPETGQVRFEIRKKLLPDRPFERGGCVLSTDAVKVEAASVPCSSLRVLTAHRTRRCQRPAMARAIRGFDSVPLREETA